jgi:hypothetical protein
MGDQRALKVKKCECGLLLHLIRIPNIGVRWIHYGHHKQMHNRILLARAAKAQKE